jgi:hypothetical protein
LDVVIDDAVNGDHIVGATIVAAKNGEIVNQRGSPSSR